MFFKIALLNLFFLNFLSCAPAQNSKSDEVAEQNEIKSESIRSPGASSVNPLTLRFDSRSSVGHSVISETDSMGFNCYDGARIEERFLNQSIYRMEFSFNPKTFIHTMKISGFHIVSATHLRNVVLAERYKNLVGMTEKERAERCGSLVVDSNFGGQSISIEYFYRDGSNNANLPTSMIFGNSVEDLGRLKEMATVFQDIKLLHPVGEAIVSIAPVIHMNFKEVSPVLQVIEYIQAVETGNFSSEILQFVHITSGPNY